MRRMLAICLVAIACPRAVSAQGRMTLGLNGGGQWSDNTLSQAFSIIKNVESAPISVSQNLEREILIDGGVRIRVARRLGVGAELSTVFRDKPADVSAAVSHPFFFNRPRRVTGTASLKRQELALHLEASYIVHTTRRVEIAAVGGPSMFRVAQNLVTDVAYRDAFPFDTATFVSAPSTRVTKSATGFNVGADVTWRLSRRFGLGAVGRYTRASASFAAAPGNATTIRFGGAQVGGGVRVGL
jgi:hypothetical protein